MQNRQIPADDSKGVGEYLQEKNELGNGIRVPATYYISINTTDTSDARKAQQLLNKPV